MTYKIINYTIPEITWYIYIRVGCSTLIGEYKVHESPRKCIYVLCWRYSGKMTFFTVYSLLLLFSVALLLHGQPNWSNMNSLCLEGYYCPAGADCSNNGSLCVKGVCEATTQQACLEGTIVAT